MRAGLAGVLLGEYFWPSFAHAFDLSAVPVQLVYLNPTKSEEDDYFIQDFRDHYAVTQRCVLPPIGTVSYLVHAGDAEWLWQADTETIQAAGVDVQTVAKLKAPALWAGDIGTDARLGEFYLTSTKIPFITTPLRCMAQQHRNPHPNILCSRCPALSA
ncbi:MAG: hypothetical protein HYR94_28220 [Chloroflexi bacterium]|nr:hypothetical protein [Chloroflexota bacterium]